jgi:hypothetical protein
MGPFVTRLSSLVVFMHLIDGYLFVAENKRFINKISSAGTSNSTPFLNINSSDKFF